MKKLIIALSIALGGLFSHSHLESYALYHDQSSIVPEVVVYAFTEEDGLERMLKHFGLEKTAIDYLAKAGMFGSTIAVMLGPVTSGVSLGVAAGLAAGSTIITAVNEFAQPFFQSIIRQKYAPAKHEIPKGGSASWNYKDIAEDLKLDNPEEARFSHKLYIVVTAPDSFIPLLQDAITIGQGYRFTIKETGEKDTEGRKKVIGVKM